MNIGQWQRSTLNQRQKALLETIENFADKPYPPTAALLHEYILLCRLLLKHVSHFNAYNFRAYMRGPFSKELRDDIETLFVRGLIETDEEKRGLKLTKDGKDLLKKVKNNTAFSSLANDCKDVWDNYKSTHEISQEIDHSLRNVNLGQIINLHDK